MRSPPFPDPDRACASEICFHTLIPSQPQCDLIPHTHTHRPCDLQTRPELMSEKSPRCCNYNLSTTNHLESANQPRSNSVECAHITPSEKKGTRESLESSPDLPAAADRSVHSPFALAGPCSTSSGQSSWSSPGLTSRLSSVAIARASSHECPVGRQSMYTMFFRQLPCENGFGGAGPGTSDLCAWFRICSFAFGGPPPHEHRRINGGTCQRRFAHKLRRRPDRATRANRDSTYLLDRGDVQ